jgi:serine/threonine protein kinase
LSYKYVREVGRGNTSIVYQYKSTSNDSSIALKMARNKAMNLVLDEEYILHKKLFEKEIKCIPEIFDPHIRYRDEKRILVLEYIDYSV